MANPLKDGEFLKRRVQIFSSKERTKFGHFGHFFEGADKKLTLWIIFMQ